MKFRILNQTLYNETIQGQKEFFLSGIDGLKKKKKESFMNVKKKRQNFFNQRLCNKCRTQCKKKILILYEIIKGTIEKSEEFRYKIK